MSSVRLPRLLLFLTGLLLATGAARATEVLDAGWRKGDLFIRFSDSTGYTIDLAQSDSVQLVVHIPGIALPANTTGEISLRSGGLNAVMAQAQGKEIRLTIQSPSRFGYVTLWRPYSKTLVIHTFDWNGLDYAQEQYYKGLLAFEQNIDKEGLDLLQVAHATGDSRASSVLGVYYARHGDLKRAEQYLSQPQDADDYAAKAAVQQHNGDATGATESRSRFDHEMANRNPDWAASGANGGPGPEAMNGPAPESGPGVRERGRDSTRVYFDPPEYGRTMMNDTRWIYIAVGTLLLLGLVFLVIWLARRGKENAKMTQAGERITFPESKPAAGKPAETKPAAPSAPIAKPEVVLRAAPPPDIYAAHKARKAARAASEPPPLEPATETAPKVEIPSAPETVPSPPTAFEPANPPTAETAPKAETAPIAETAPKAETAPIAETAPEAEPAPEPIASEPRQSNPVPLQAAEIRRRIEAMRTPPSPPHTDEGNLSGKTTIAEARRLNLSRDTVELRRRMEEAGEGE
ncbi:MAG: hypothetical protein JWQ98_3268 [Chlorobi bacterium]|nr:hypothetical protein [Chlorobiota bacterium]